MTPELVRATKPASTGQHAGLRGDCSRLQGDLDACGLTTQAALAELEREHRALRSELTRVTAELDGYRSGIELFVWNLVGCDTIASGRGKPGEYNKEKALPALDSVSRMASDLAALRARVAELEQSKRTADFLCELHGCCPEMVLYWCEFEHRRLALRPSR